LERRRLSFTCLVAALASKKADDQNWHHHLELPLQQTGTTVVREPPSAHTRGRRNGLAAAKPRALSAHTMHTAAQPPRPRNQIKPGWARMVAAASGVAGAATAVSRLARPTALPPPAPAFTPRGDGGVALPEPDPRRIQLQPPRGARPRQARRRPRPGAAAPACLDAAPPTAAGRRNEPVHLRLHGEYPLEAFGGEDAHRHRVVGPQQRRRRGARVGGGSRQRLLGFPRVAPSRSNAGSGVMIRAIEL
jgi:hypothetical protein